MSPLRAALQGTLRTFFYTDATPTEDFKRHSPKEFVDDLQQIPRNVPKLTPMGAVRSTQPTANSFLKLTAMRGVAYEPMSYIELTLP